MADVPAKGIEKMYGFERLETLLPLADVVGDGGAALAADPSSAECGSSGSSEIHSHRD